MSHYCKSPWMSLFVYDNGKVKSCCSGQWDWGNLHDNTLQEIINNPKVVQLRKDISEGKHNSYCDYCKSCEKDTGDSQRSYFTKFVMTDDALSDPDLFELQMVDMRWNNLCNLNCVYCTPLWSTTWQKLKGEPMTNIKVNHYGSVLEEVKNRGDNIEAIIMGGGEPLLHQMNVELLQSIKENALVDIMTNLSTNLEHSSIFKELKKKTNVTWCISFENLGDELEFVRHGASWDKVLENIKLLKSVAGHSIIIKPTYNILCATRLVRLYEFLNEYDLMIHWQTLINPSALCVTNFSEPVLRLCLDEINRLLESEAFNIYTQSNRLQQGLEFFNHLKSEIANLIENPASNITNTYFNKWIDDYHKKYASDANTFSMLWPDLNNALSM